MHSFVLVLLAALVALPASAQSTYEIPTWETPVPGSFITLAGSDLSGLANTIPDINVAEEVDTSGWVEFNVTTAGGTGRLSSCGNMDRTGSSDNSDAFNCMMRNMGDNALLYFPDGTYDFGRAYDGFSVFRPSQHFDNRGLRCESRGAVLNMTGDNNNTVFLAESEDRELGTSRSWNGGTGAARGETVIRVNSTSGFTVGGWVYLRANPTAVQDIAERQYYSKIASIGAGTLTLDRALPDDFSGGGATAAPWFPTENLVLENCTMRMEHPDHQRMGLGFLWRMNAVGSGHIKNVHFHSTYQYHLLIENSARILVTGTDFSDSHWDKPFNGYSVMVHNSSEISFVDGHMEGSPQNIACGGGSQGLVFAFMDIRGPLPNQPAFDRGCNEGTGNICRQVSHGHPLHCSSHSFDLDGTNGDAACRGTSVDVTSGSLLFHNKSCSQTAVIRSNIEPQIWLDFQGGPGRNNFFYGNTLAARGTTSADGAQGEPGDYVVKQEQNSQTPEGYRQNFIWANNTVENFGVTGGFNRMGDGVQVLDNVIRGRCFYNNGSGENADGGACTRINEGGNSPGRNDVFNNNTVGSGTHPSGYSRTMPSAPGFSDWSMLEGADLGQAPFVGPEMGDPDSAPGCLPATRRWYGSCQ